MDHRVLSPAVGTKKSSGNYSFMVVRLRCSKLELEGSRGTLRIVHWPAKLFEKVNGYSFNLWGSILQVSLG